MLLWFEMILFDEMAGWLARIIIFCRMIDWRRAFAAIDAAQKIIIFRLIFGSDLYVVLLFCVIEHARPPATRPPWLITR